MKKTLLILFSNILFAQGVPSSNSISTSAPPTSNDSTTINEELHYALRPFIETEKYGLGIIRYYPTSEYSSTGATFKIYNPSKKTIKYIWFTVAGENPVGDLVKTGTGYYKTLKAIGPVKSNGIGEWSFDYVWFTDVVEALKMTTIKIQYMDLSLRTIKYNDKMYLGETAYDNVILALNKKDVVEEKKKYDRNVSIDDQTIFSDVDQAAEFPGGIGSFRATLTTNLNVTNVNDADGSINGEIILVVEKDGSISDIKANGRSSDFNAELIRVIKSLNKKWVSAKINSTPVRSVVRLPVSMNIEK